MPTLPDKVQPGDVISSELMTEILTQLAELRDTNSTGGQAVPDLFGRRLDNAYALITDSSRQLTMGFVIDVSGATVDLFSADGAERLVLNQDPAANSRVAAGAPVNLIVSRNSVDTSPPTEPAPVITRTETLEGATATDFPVGGTMVIIGNNFSGVAAENTVRFDGTPAGAVTVPPSNSTRQLNVIVPTGIPDAPQNADDSSKPDVQVTVQTPAGNSESFPITVTAPIPGQPTISSVEPTAQNEGENITINGTNFQSDVEVRIDDVAATIVSRTSTEIVATVPNFPDLNPGTPRSVSLVVSIPGVGDVVFGDDFLVFGV